MICYFTTLSLDQGKREGARVTAPIHREGAPAAGSAAVHGQEAGRGRAQGGHAAERYEQRDVLLKMIIRIGGGGVADNLF